MRQKKASSHRSIVSSIVASVCILAYIAALAYAAVKIYASIDEYQSLAEREFFNLADLSAAAGVLGFMDEPFREAVRDGLIKSKTLEGVIISGSNGEYAFEREPGRVIAWSGDVPRFKTRLGLSADPYHVPLRVEGQRNVTISAVYNYVDYEYLIKILKFTLLVVLAALTLAFFTLMLEFLLGKSRVSAGNEDYLKDHEDEPPAAPGFDDTWAFDTASPGEPALHEEPVPPEAPPPGGVQPGGDGQSGEAAKEEASGAPQGLYSPRGNIGWEAYTRDRLNSELHRCASFEQDLVLIIMEFKARDDLPDSLYNRFAEETVNFFALRDLIFERGKQGITVIIPNIDLDQGFAKSKEFHNQASDTLGEFFTAGTGICIGISSRSGRLIDADRLLFEASQAVKRALKDPASSIVAFKSDPEKYRAFIASQNKRHP
jgi:hypothetical protein